MYKEGWTDKVQLLCFRKAAGMARETLKGFYNSRAWRRQRMLVLQRDKFTCTEKGCNQIATEVHHIIELSENNVNDLNIALNENNLRSLCHECHTRITKRIKSNTENILPEILFDRNGFPIEIK